MYTEDISTTTDMSKLTIKYANSPDELVFDIDPDRDPHSRSKVTPEVMLGRLLLAGSNQTMVVDQPLRVYKHKLTADEAAFLTDRYSEVDGRSFSEGQEVLAVKDGNTRLEAIYLGLEDNIPVAPIPYVLISKEQLNDAVYMAALPIILNQSSARMGAFDEARSLSELLQAIIDRQTQQASDRGENPTTDDIKQNAKAELLEQVADISSDQLEAALLIVDRQIDDQLMDALNDNLLSLASALAIVNKAETYKKEGATQVTLLDKASESATVRGSYVEVEENGEIIKLAKISGKDVDAAIDFYKEIRANAKVESKVAAQEIELPEFLEIQVSQGLPLTTASKIMEVAETKQKPIEEVFHAAVDVATESDSEAQVNLQDLKPSYVSKGIKALEKAAKQAAKPSKEPKETKAAKEPKRELTTAEMMEEVRETLLLLQSSLVDVEEFILDPEDPNVASQYKNVNKIWNMFEKLERVESESEEEEAVEEAEPVGTSF